MHAGTPFILQALTQTWDNDLIARVSCLTFAFITPVFVCKSLVFVVKMPWPEKMVVKLTRLDDVLQSGLSGSGSC